MAGVDTMVRQLHIATVHHIPPEQQAHNNFYKKQQTATWQKIEQNYQITYNSPNNAN